MTCKVLVIPTMRSHKGLVIPTKRSHKGLVIPTKRNATHLSFRLSEAHGGIRFPFRGCGIGGRIPPRAAHGRDDTY